MVTRAVVLVVVLRAAAGFAQTPADALREGNTAAAQGDWARVSSLVDPLLRGQLPSADLAEAHRLLGLAAFFQNRKPVAEHHFVAYLRIELDGRLDPALYPPEVVNFFGDVRQRHDAELRKRRPQPRRYWALNLIPPGGQLQNGDTTKAWIVGGAIGVFAVANVSSYLVLRSWCTEVSGTGGSSVTCDAEKDRSSSAATLRVVNIASGLGLILAYGYGVYDGARGYRRNESIQPFVAPTTGGSVGGVFGVF